MPSGSDSIGPGSSLDPWNGHLSGRAFSPGRAYPESVGISVFGGARYGGPPVDPRF